MSKIKGIPYTKDSSDRKKYLSRISKSLYYGKLPKYDSLSLPLTEFSIQLFSKIKKGKSVDRLHYDEAVSISHKACISPCSLILALLYVDKLKENNPEYLERTPTADLFLVSLMISSKFLFDDGESDEVFIDNWASSAGITTSELVVLEREFLKAIDWRIFVSERNFWKTLTEIEEKLAKIQGVSRGHFTYTELEKLLKITEICDIVKCVLSVSAILAVVYSVGLFTIFTSFYLVSNIPGTSLYANKIVDRNETKVTAQICYNETCTYTDKIKIGSFKNNSYQINMNLGIYLDISDEIKKETTNFYGQHSRFLWFRTVES